MATLYKHGEIGQVERLACKHAYCLDGKILRNQGDGWKLYAKLKPGIDPREHFEKAKANYQRKLDTMPCFADWRKQFHAAFSFTNRYMALTVISSMPQDPDGCWSEMTDCLNMSVDIDEIVSLCRAYEAAQAEAKHMKEQAALTPAIS